MSNEQGMAFLGLLQLQAAVDRLGAVLDSAGWQTVVRTLSVASCTDHLLTVRCCAGKWVVCGVGDGVHHAFIARRSPHAACGTTGARMQC